MNQVIKPQAAGTLDPSFIGGFPPDGSQTVLALSDRKLLIASGLSDHWPLRLARLHEDGSPDHSFGGGVVDVPLPPGVAAIPSKITELLNGNYLIACRQRGSSAILYLIQLFPDGSLVPTFGVAGLVTLTIVDTGGAGSSGSQAPGAVSSIGQPCMAISELNGAIYLGSSFSSDKKIKGIVFGLKLDGSSNPGFHGGHLLIEDTNKNVRVDALAATGQGLLVAGASIVSPANEGDAFVASFDQKGNAIPSFGNGGKVLIPGNDGRLLSVASIAIGLNGSILVSGYWVGNGESGGLLIVLNPSGSFNLVFNRGVPLYSDFVKNLYFYACFWQQDDRILVTGLGDGGYLTMARYNPDGSLDTTFGVNGWAVHRDMPDSRYKDSALTVDSKIVILGGEGDTIHAFAVRYLLS